LNTQEENGIYILVIYDIQLNLVNVIHFTDPLGVFIVYHYSNEDDFFILSQHRDLLLNRGFQEINHYKTEKLEEWEIDSRFFCKLVKTIQSNFTSIVYLKATLKKKINYDGKEFHILGRTENQLVFSSDSKLVNFNLELNEVMDEFQHPFPDYKLSKTQNYIYHTHNGWKTNIPRKRWKIR
jgi:hypothetical protein